MIAMTTSTLRISKRQVALALAAAVALAVVTVAWMTRHDPVYCEIIRGQDEAVAVCFTLDRWTGQVYLREAKGVPRE